MIPQSGLLLELVEIDTFAALCDRKASVSLVTPAGALILLRGKCKFDLFNRELIKVAEMRIK